MSISLQVAEDAYNGNAAFDVIVDGTQLATETVTALKNSGEWQTITLNDLLPSGAHSIALTFLNDTYGGTSAADRNLYVRSIAYGNTTVTENAALKSTGSTVTANITVPASSDGVQLLGVNLSGAEYGDPVTGVMNYDYVYPTTDEIDYFSNLGLNVIRIPVAWQRL